MEEEVFGVKMEVFKHAPQNLALVLQGARAHGDKTFLLYEGERFTFANVMDQVDGLAHLLVNKYGIKKGDRVAVAMRNYPEWIISFAAIVSVGAVNVSFNAWWTEDEMFSLVTSSASTQRTTHAVRWESRCSSCVQKPKWAPTLMNGLLK
jgi:long-chain acyl-CoA synthetase